MKSILSAFLVLALMTSVTLAQKPRKTPPAVNSKPYDAQLLQLAELLGAIHYLRELCGANDKQLWRNKMSDLVKAEGVPAIRRIRLVNQFNKGYRGYKRIHRQCTDSARLAVKKSMITAARIANQIVDTNE